MSPKSTQESHKQDFNKLDSTTQDRSYQFPRAIFQLLGPLIGVLLVQIYKSGVFEEWHDFNPPPSKPVEFVGVNIYFYLADPYILGVDGKTYYCDIQVSILNGRQQIGCEWKIEHASRDVVLKECQPNGVKFWGGKNILCDGGLRWGPRLPSNQGSTD